LASFKVITSSNVQERNCFISQLDLNKMAAEQG